MAFKPYKHLFKQFLKLRRHQNVEVGSDGQAQYVGPSNDDQEAASVRADCPIPNKEFCR